MIFDDDEAGPGWLRTVVPIDPLLNAPLDLYGTRARRKTQIDALVELCGLGYRAAGLEGGLHSDTYRLMWPMVERLATAMDRKRIHIGARAKAIVTDELEYLGGPIQRRIDGCSAFRAILDFGWSHHQVSGGTALETLDNARSLYVWQMTIRVERALRQLERRGLIADAA